MNKDIYTQDIGILTFTKKINCVQWLAKIENK